jgi:multidrug efflux pump subunit AcrA (membrane-fusion protein)
MRFRGWIETERIADVVLLPLSSIEVTAEGPVVYRRGLAGVRAVPVSLGRRSREAVEVLDGLDEGDSIRSLPPMHLRNGR